VFALLAHERALAPADIAWCVLAGLCGPTALVFFYRGLATGRMGVVAPIAGVLSAAIPVVVGVAVQGLPRSTQIVGIALALLSVLLVTRATDSEARGKAGVGYAVVAGLGFGAFFVFLGRVDPGSVFAPLVVVRVVATALMCAVTVFTRGEWRAARPSYVPIVVAGTLDMGGNLFYLLAAQQGRLDIAAVLASLYPVVTILLAAAVLRERIGVHQAIGIGVAVGAIALIAAG
jgi:drug/metabolite transporter (DMT)-like permease